MKKQMVPEKAQDFYTRVLETLVESKFPFMVGGAYALKSYTGITRPTKDFDIFCIEDDYPKILKTLADAGFITELTDSHWIVKVTEKKEFVDFIFADAEGLYKVNKSWLRDAKKGEVLGFDVKLMPPEQIIMTKMYRQKRDHYDGADVLHLMLKQGEVLDWHRILSGMASHWMILLSFVIQFQFVYPSDKDVIPKWLVDELLKRYKKELTKKEPKQKICRGLLITPNNGSEYEIDVTEWGYIPEKHKGRYEEK